jgi:hypothetical protein
MKSNGTLNPGRWQTFKAERDDLPLLDAAEDNAKATPYEGGIATRNTPVKPRVRPRRRTA